MNDWLENAAWALAQWHRLAAAPVPQHARQALMLDALETAINNAREERDDLRNALRAIETLDDADFDAHDYVEAVQVRARGALRGEYR